MRTIRLPLFVLACLVAARGAMPMRGAGGGVHRRSDCINSLVRPQTGRNIRDQMLSALAKALDWAAIQVLSRRIPSTGSGGLRIDEALEFLNGTNFIPAQSEPAQIEFDAGEPESHFHFPTPRPGERAENNMVYGQLYRSAKAWREKPAVILLHGWNSGLSYRFRFPWTARRCNREGYNAAFAVLPDNFQRRPRHGWFRLFAPGRENISGRG